MNTNNLSTTTSQKVTEKTTGMPPSDFGVGALSSWVTKHRKPGTILNQPEFLPVMLTQSEIILIDTIARATSEALLELKDHKELAPLKKKIDGVIHNLEVQMQPAPNETIVKSLQVLGNTFQTELPQREGLKYYIEAIKDIPAIFLKDAIVSVMKTHKYNTFPLPATIREPVDNKINFCQSFLGWCRSVLHRLTTFT
mgnify:FL=1